MNVLRLNKSLIIAAAAGAALAAAPMRAMSQMMPEIAGQPTPTFERRPAEKDGLGRRKRPKQHPRHDASRWRPGRADFLAKVVATHSDRPDPRDDKYLHSAARAWRNLDRAFAEHETRAAGRAK